MCDTPPLVARSQRTPQNSLRPSDPRGPGSPSRPRCCSSFRPVCAHCLSPSVRPPRASPPALESPGSERPAVHLLLLLLLPRVQFPPRARHLRMRGPIIAPPTLFSLRPACPRKSACHPWSDPSIQIPLPFSPFALTTLSPPSVLRVPLPPSDCLLRCLMASGCPVLLSSRSSLQPAASSRRSHIDMHPAACSRSSPLPALERCSTTSGTFLLVPKTHLPSRARDANRRLPSQSRRPHPAARSRPLRHVSPAPGVPAHACSHRFPHDLADCCADGAVCRPFPPLPATHAAAPCGCCCCCLAPCTPVCSLRCGHRSQASSPASPSRSSPGPCIQQPNSQSKPRPQAPSRISHPRAGPRSRSRKR